MDSLPGLGRLLNSRPPASIPPLQSSGPTASFNTLPPELKAQIVLHIAHQERLDALKAEEEALADEEDDPFVLEMITSDDDSEVEEVEGDEDEEGIIAESGWTDPPSVDSLWNLARVNRELSELAWPHLWRSAPDRYCLAVRG